MSKTTKIYLSLFVVVALLIVAFVLFGGSKKKLERVAQSMDSNWNAIALKGDGTIFAAGPRWSGIKGAQLTKIDKNGGKSPYPDQEWNAWKTGAKTENAFININAIRNIDNQLWVVDTGAPDFGGTPIPGGAKLVVISLETDKVEKIYFFNSSIAGEGSYVDDLRILGNYAYLTDAGWPGLIVLNLETAQSRRVLNNDVSTIASDRPIIVDGEPVLAPNGELLKVNADPLELSPDGKWLYYGPLNGPMYRVPTASLNDASLSDEDLKKQVEFWFDMPPSGGVAITDDGTFYFSDLAKNALMKRTPDGRIEMVVQDKRLHWVDAPVIDADNVIWMPIPQIERVSLFQKGENKTQWPVEVLKYPLK